jgi:two-component system response regulator YesN
MIKVLIVDDEIIFRIGIKSCINWGEHGFNIIGEAGNGVQALDMMAKHKPDVVFTDIKMPVMDGLELTRQIFANYPNTIVVILSCYNDFEYVKEALKLGAMDYILKLSMEPSDLEELIINLKRTIEEKRKSEYKESVIKQEFYSNLEAMKEIFLKRLIFEEQAISYEELTVKIESLGLRIIPENNVVVVLKLNDYKDVVNKVGDENLLKFGVMNIVGEILNRRFRGEVFYYQKEFFICIVGILEEHGSQIWRESLSCVLKDIASSIKTYLSLTVSAGVSSNYGKLSDLKKLYEEAFSALDMCFYSGKGSIEFYHNSLNYMGNQSGLCLQNEIKIEESMEMLDTESVIKYIEETTENFKATCCIHPSKVKETYKEILFILNRAAKRYGGDIGEIGPGNPYDTVDQIDTLIELDEWLRCFVHEVLDYIKKLKSQLYRYEVSKVLDYIKINIHRNIDLKEASRVANMSPKYFCQVFKKEIGKNFVDYVSELKIELAKEMLKDRNAKIREIAYELGFLNEGYFSRIFKRYTGMPPQEYRKKI